MIIPASTQELLAIFGNPSPKRVLNSKRMYNFLSQAVKREGTILSEDKAIAKRAMQLDMVEIIIPGIYQAKAKALNFVKLYQELSDIRENS